MLHVTANSHYSREPRHKYNCIYIMNAGVSVDDDLDLDESSHLTDNVINSNLEAHLLPSVDSPFTPLYLQARWGSSR